MFEGFWQGRNPSGTSRLFGTACKPCVIFSFLFFLFFLFLLFFSLQCIPLSWRVLGWLLLPVPPRQMGLSLQDRTRVLRVPPAILSPC